MMFQLSPRTGPTDKLLRSSTLRLASVAAAPHAEPSTGKNWSRWPAGMGSEVGQSSMEPENYLRMERARLRTSWPGSTTFNRAGELSPDGTWRCSRRSRRRRSFNGAGELSPDGTAREVLAAMRTVPSMEPENYLRMERTRTDISGRFSGSFNGAGELSPDGTRFPHQS